MTISVLLAFSIVKEMTLFLVFLFIITVLSMHIKLAFQGTYLKISNHTMCFYIISKTIILTSL